MMVGMQRGQRRPVWRTVLRGLLSIVLFAGAVASLIYGAKYHFVPVSEEGEIEISIAPPPPLPPMGIPGELPFETPGMGPPLGEMPPPDMEQPFGEPELPGPAAPHVEPFPPGLPPFFDTIKQKVITTEDESEPTLIREVTFGGVTLLDSGELLRTYTGQPPSMCPT